MKLRSLSVLILTLLLAGCASIGFAPEMSGEVVLGGEEDESAQDEQPSGDDGSGDQDDTSDPGDDSDPGSDPGSDPDPGSSDNGTDYDQDGYSDDVDCDDWNAEVHPGAEEVACDGHDNDCDGLFHPDDTDDDGDGYSECLGDCDDLEVTIGDGMPEVQCDGIDQDCDGIDLCDDPADPADPPVPPSAAPTTPDCAGASLLGVAGSTATSTSGSLSAADSSFGSGPWYYDSYQVFVLLPSFYSVNLVSPDFDAWVEVYDSNCNLVTADDDSFGGTDASAQLFSTGLGEEFYLVATSYYPQGIGSYTISIE